MPQDLFSESTCRRAAVCSAALRRQCVRRPIHLLASRGQSALNCRPPRRLSLRGEPRTQGEPMAESIAPRSRALRAGEWLTLRQVMQEILDDDPDARIAFAISGGGATGAYEAGAIDAWLRCVVADFPAARAALTPRFILGSSAGALNATTLLVQALNGDAGPDFGLQTWKAICPRAAPLVVGPARSFLVDLATRWIKLPRKLLLPAGLAALGAFVVLLLTAPAATAAAAAIS